MHILGLTEEVALGKLEHEPHALHAFLQAAPASALHIPEADVPGGLLAEPRQQLQERRLARPAAPDDEVEAVGRQRHVDARDERSLGARRVEAQVADVDCGTAGRTQGGGGSGLLLLGRREQRGHQVTDGGRRGRTGRG